MPIAGVDHRHQYPDQVQPWPGAGARHRASPTGVRVATTDRNAIELADRLAGKFGLDDATVATEVARVLAPFEIVYHTDYDHLGEAALARLRPGGRSDWPVLAAALALEGEIWSEDVDFFGVGVPIWTTGNIRFVTPSPEAGV